MTSSSRPTATATALTAAGLLAAVWLQTGTSGATPAIPAAQPAVLWGDTTIPPGRDGIIEAKGFTTPPPTPPLGTASTLTLTAPPGTRVTGVPLDTPGYRGTVAADGRTATYTATATATAAERPWRDGAFPFVLAVPADAVPGTRLSGCVLRLADANGQVRATGGCQVTVGLAEPTLARPESGVPLEGRPAIAGRAHPGAQITVSDKDGDEVCTDTTGSDGLWVCTPDRALPEGPNRLQATATLNGVSAASEQIQITVAR